MAGERKRRHHRRSRNGCITCKKRHMRCDETKPFCHNCLKHGGRCGYLGVEALNLDTPSQDFNPTEFQQCVPFIETRLSAARSDPFNSLRIEMSPESGQLFDHFNHYRTLVRTPTLKKPGGEMLGFVTSDEGLMNCAILLAADHFMLLGGNRAIAESAFYHHKLEAIRIVNERLGNPQMATAEATVGTVACLTLAEATNGNWEAATSHLNGLEQLIKLRGDLALKRMSGCLQRLILLAHSMTAAATHSPQRFQGELSRTKGSSLGINNRAANPIGHDIWTGSMPALFQDFECPDLQTIEMFRNLHYLSGQITISMSRNNNVQNDAKLMENIFKAEQHVELIIHHGGGTTGTFGLSSDNSSITTVQSSALAGAIYVYFFLRDIPVDSSVFDWMVTLMKEGFQWDESVIGQNIPAEVLFWVLFVGRAAAVGRDERHWFCARLDRARRDLMLSCWEEAKGVLRRLAWIEGPRDSDFKELWEELDGTPRVG